MKLHKDYCVHVAFSKLLTPSTNLQEVQDMAVVVKTVFASHFGVGAPPILEPILVGIGILAI